MRVGKWVRRPGNGVKEGESAGGLHVAGYDARQAGVLPHLLLLLSKVALHVSPPRHPLSAGFKPLLPHMAKRQRRMVRWRMATRWRMVCCHAHDVGMHTQCTHSACQEGEQGRHGREATARRTAREGTSLLTSCSLPHRRNGRGEARGDTRNSASVRYSRGLHSPVHPLALCPGSCAVLQCCSVAVLQCVFLFCECVRFVCIRAFMCVCGRTCARVGAWSLPRGEYWHAGAISWHVHVCVPQVHEGVCARARGRMRRGEWLGSKKKGKAGARQAGKKIRV